MKKTSFREKMRYAFDNYMGKGTLALIGMLFLITAVVVVTAGALSCLVNPDGSLGTFIWMSMMHAIDAGTLAGDDTAKIGYIILMSVVTVCGIFVTSILIGIISSGFEEKLNSLKKGFSRVIEKNHTVIIGFNDGVYTIISELIEANANQKNGRILVIGTQDKEEMENEIRGHIDDFKTSKVICRSGNPAHSAVLEMSSVETARSIIINEEDDFRVIRCLLSVIAYLKDENVYNGDIHLTAVIHEKRNLDAARIAGEGKADIIYFKDMIARVVANTCRQPGLSMVLTDMFDFGGAEFYFEEFPELAGKKFGDILNLFRISTAVGIGRGDEVLLNPPMDTVLAPGDKVIHFAEDDGVSHPSASLPSVSLQGKLPEKPFEEHTKLRMLILGVNDSLPLILQELSEFTKIDLQITVANDVINDEIKAETGNADRIHFIRDDIFERSVLEKLLADGIDNVLLLSDDSGDQAEGDARNLLLLLQIRDIEAKRGITYNITSEMNSTENQRLMKVAKVNDFVVGNSITNLILTQISENRHLAELFHTLLISEGSELYMKSVKNYLKPGVEVSFYEATEAVKMHNEIFLGYRRQSGSELTIVTNPDKTEKFTFKPEDYLIVLAED